MENNHTFREIISPVAAVSIAVSVFLVVCLLWYSAEQDVTFHVWGKEFGAVVNPSSQISNLKDKIDDLEQILDNVESDLSSNKAIISKLEAPQPNENSTQPINKERVVDVGQQWDIHEIGFSMALRRVIGFEGAAKFEALIKTPESQVYTTYVYEGWQRQFEADGRAFTVTIKETNLDTSTLKVIISEIGA